MDKDKVLKEISNSFDDLLTNYEPINLPKLSPEWIQKFIKTGEDWDKQVRVKIDKVTSDLTEEDRKSIEHDIEQIIDEYNYRFRSKMDRVSPTKMD